MSRFRKITGHVYNVENQNGFNNALYDYFSATHKQIKKSASDVWEYDEKRKTILEKNGYEVLIIWKNEYNKNKEEIYKKINEYYEIY